VQLLRALVLNLFEPAASRPEHPQQGEALQVSHLRAVLRPADEPRPTPEKARKRRTDHPRRSRSSRKILSSPNGAEGRRRCRFRRYSIDELVGIVVYISSFVGSISDDPGNVVVATSNVVAWSKTVGDQKRFRRRRVVTSQTFAKVKKQKINKVPDRKKPVFCIYQSDFVVLYRIILKL
jgi:hypothetical protein